MATLFSPVGLTLTAAGVSWLLWALCWPLSDATRGQSAVMISQPRSAPRVFVYTRMSLRTSHVPRHVSSPPSRGRLTRVQNGAVHQVVMVTPTRCRHGRWAAEISALVICDLLTSISEIRCSQEHAGRTRRHAHNHTHTKHTRRAHTAARTHTHTRRHAQQHSRRLVAPQDTREAFITIIIIKAVCAYVRVCERV